MDPLTQLIQSVRNAFHPSPERIAETIGAIALFLGVFIVFYVVEVRKHRRAERTRDAVSYAKKREQADLLPSEEDIIDNMASFLRPPAQKHMLLENQTMFNMYAHRLMNEHTVPEAAISALRVKLGFVSEASEGAPVSTAALPPGGAVLIAYRDVTYHAKVVGVRTGSLQVQLIRIDRPAIFPIGAEVSVVYQNRRGVFSMRTNIVDQEDELLSLSHSEEVVHTQQRRHYRRPFDFPVFVKTTGEGGKPDLSRFIDLGGGGASLLNPSARYKQGNLIDIAFRLDADEEHFNVTARVVRLSHNGTVMHVEFGRLRESIRDKIYRVIFSRGDRNGFQNTGKEG